MYHLEVLAMVVVICGHEKKAHYFFQEYSQYFPYLLKKEVIMLEMSSDRPSFTLLAIFMPFFSYNLQNQIL